MCGRVLRAYIAFSHERRSIAVSSRLTHTEVVAGIALGVLDALNNTLIASSLCPRARKIQAIPSLMCVYHAEPGSSEDRNARCSHLVAQQIPLHVRSRSACPRHSVRPSAIECSIAYHSIGQTTRLYNRLDQAAWEHSWRRSGGLLRGRLPLRR